MKTKTTLPNRTQAKKAKKATHPLEENPWDQKHGLTKFRELKKLSKQALWKVLEIVSSLPNCVGHNTHKRGQN